MEDSGLLVSIMNSVLKRLAVKCNVSVSQLLSQFQLIVRMTVVIASVTVLSSMEREVKRSQIKKISMLPCNLDTLLTRLIIPDILNVPNQALKASILCQVRTKIAIVMNTALL